MRGVNRLVLTAFAASRRAIQPTAGVRIQGSLMARAFSSSEQHYTIGLTGSGGLVGKAVLNEIRQRETLQGKPIRVICLVRGDKAEAPTGGDTLVWNPTGAAADDVLHPQAVAEMDAIVHLSGENVSTGLGPLGFLGIRPWTDQKKAEIVNSRVETTTALSKAVAAAADNKNKPKTFLVASGVGVYGDKFIGDSLEAADESANVDGVDGFLAHVSREWEGATEEAVKSGKHRVVNMRFGVVMSKKGGALQKLYPVFLLGGGGRIGGGQQYFSFISARDIARAILHTLETPSLEGPVNFCAPHPCTNLEFTKALGSVLRRPTILPFPGFAVNLLFGEMGEEMLLGGVRVVPSKLLDSGFEFLHPTINSALQSAMDEDI
ncbi:Epimerase family protein SDR39U1 [Seminavis robusta]|uniref:Epimerase family protein SDR39U1 n=1 Tax=Seminavis robusta TaxID=568900 RepID=A0A9N8H7R4_9STRA|nr:Epimerase family protein SDR39U1 [Seminavis robusta]|eukprot:Sro73_g040510.1 Epimerase family protein SDR39U1 (377) ;mRNA; f:117678-118808